MTLLLVAVKQFSRATVGELVDGTSVDSHVGPNSFLLGHHALSAVGGIHLKGCIPPGSKGKRN